MIDWNSLPIIGPFLDWLTQAASALVDGLAALWSAKNLFMESIQWLPADIVSILVTVAGVMFVMKVFGR